MALSAAFRERLDQMEYARNQRLLLLQAEKELQASKSQILASKLASIRSMEQRCAWLHHEISLRNFKILALRSEIEKLDSQHDAVSDKLRVLRSEVEEAEEMEKEKERFYEMKCLEMESFRKDVEKFVLESQRKTKELKTQINERKSTFVELQGSDEFLSNCEIAEAEMRKAELIATKAALERTLASNHQLRSQLQNQLQSMLRQNHERKQSQMIT